MNCSSQTGVVTSLAGEVADITTGLNTTVIPMVCGWEGWVELVVVVVRGLTDQHVRMQAAALCFNSDGPFACAGPAHSPPLHSTPHLGWRDAPSQLLGGHGGYGRLQPERRLFWVCHGEGAGRLFEACDCTTVCDRTTGARSSGPAVSIASWVLARGNGRTPSLRDAALIGARKLRPWPLHRQADYASCPSPRLAPAIAPGHHGATPVGRSRRL